MNIRRLLVAVGAPLVVVVGLGVAWGVRKGSAMVELIDGWSDSLAHSSNAVAMRVEGIPVISTLHVDGERIGKLSEVVVLRDQPGAVDSLRVVVRDVDAARVASFDDCQLMLDPGVFETIDGPGDALSIIKRVVRCDSHNPDLVPFGSVVFADAGRTTQLFLERRYHPCEHGDQSEACADFRDDLQIEVDHLRGLRDEIRKEVRDRAVTVRIR